MNISLENGGMPMTEHQRRLFTRLDEIVTNLKKDPHVIALLTLGSVGLETKRIDEYSDLDFFVITEDGYASSYLLSHDWLETSSPLSFIFQNTVDGFKLLYQDGVYGECAIFNQSKLKDIPYHQARLHYLKEGSHFDFKVTNTMIHPKASKDYLMNEALTNLYVGLLRYHRGEIYSSYLFISHHALSNVLRLATYNDKVDDPFDISRRIEKNHPQLVPLLTVGIQGYEKVRESAHILVNYLESNYPVNQAIVARIKSLL